MQHRHLDIADDVPVTELPLVALGDVLDRGTLRDWRPILDEIEADPRGGFTERIARLVIDQPMYGTSKLIQAWIERCRRRVAGSP